MNNITMLIGSLPYARVESISLEQAIEKALFDSAIRVDIPTMPQLPFPEDPEKRFDPYMIDELKTPGKLVSAERFKDSVRYRNEVKIQSCGPITAILHGGLNENEAVSRVSDHLTGLADGLNADTIYVFLDEPSVNYFLDKTKLLDLWNRVYQKVKLPNGAKMVRGVHTCADVSFSSGVLFDPIVEVIAFDAVRYNLVSDNYSQLKSYRERGGRICWGIIDIRNNGSAALLDLKEFNKGDLISPVCGFGNLPVDAPKKAVDYLLQFRKKLI